MVSWGPSPWFDHGVICYWSQTCIRGFAVAAGAESRGFQRTSEPIRVPSAFSPGCIGGSLLRPGSCLHVAQGPNCSKGSAHLRDGQVTFGLYQIVSQFSVSSVLCESMLGF